MAVIKRILPFILGTVIDAYDGHRHEASSESSRVENDFSVAKS